MSYVQFTIPWRTVLFLTPENSILTVCVLTVFIIAKVEPFILEPVVQREREREREREKCGQLDKKKSTTRYHHRLCSLASAADSVPK